MGTTTSTQTPAGTDVPVATMDRARVQLDVSGMSCASCAARVQTALNKLPEVRASVNFGTRVATIEAPAGIDDTVLCDVVRKAGCDASPREAGTARIDDPDAEHARTLMLRLAVAAVLFVIGLVHSVLLASNDVLRAYALAGLALPLLAPLGHRALYAIAIGLVAVHVGAGIVVFGSAVVDVYVGRVGSDAALFAERQFGSDPGALNYALELGREGLGERAARRLEGFGSQLRALAASLPLNLAAMALGMALWKDRMLAGGWRTFRLQRLAAICAIIAIPSLLALAWWVSDSGFPAAFAGAGALVLRGFFQGLEAARLLRKR